MGHYRLKGTSGSVINQSFPFGDIVVLGSSAECDITLEDEGVSPVHAEIRSTGDGLSLKDLGSDTGTLLNGQPVVESPLRSGDEIRIGTNRWMLQAPGLRPERVLTAEVVKPGVNWLRVLAWSAVAAVAAAAVLYAWKPEWLAGMGIF
jgi:hypothetical protein